MISIEDYQDFLTKIKSLDQDIQVKLESILNKRLDGILPKKYMFSHEQINKYDYTYDLDENLISFLDLFDKYYYPQQLVDDNICNKINDNLNILHEIYRTCKNLDKNSFKNISEIMLFFGKIGDSLYDTYKKIETTFLNNKKDMLINILLSYFKNNDINIDIINSILEDSIDINDFFNKIEFKLNENIRNNFKLYGNFMEVIIDTKNKLFIIQWYIFSNEMKFLDKINIIEYNIQNIIENLSEIYENKFIKKNSIELDNGIIIEEEINLLNEYTNNLNNIEKELVNNVYLRSHEFSTNEINHQIFEEELEKIIFKYKLSKLDEYDFLVKQLRMNESMIKLDNSMNGLVKILDKLIN